MAEVTPAEKLRHTYHPASDELFSSACTIEPPATEATAGAMSSGVEGGPTSMLIIAGHLVVAETDRDAYVAACVPIVEAARSAPGCLDFSITADTVNPAHVLIFERWEDEEQLLAFRGSGPDEGPEADIVDADVKRYVISAVGEP